MIKIFMSVRNRLAITKKSIEALKKHSKFEHKIYIYDNSTNYKLAEHFGFFYKLYENKLIDQITFTSKESTFNAFSKAASCNMFGLQHEQDPQKDKYAFLVLMDNDMIVTPNWDEIVFNAWSDVKKNGLNNIRIISQLPGGITYSTKCKYSIAGLEAKTGKLGGSAFWCIKPNFFKEVGFLDLKQLVGQNKKHDQLYWRLLDKSAVGKDYIIGLKTKLALHCGAIAGSCCNVLSNKSSNKEEAIKFTKQEEDLSKQSFDDFFQSIQKNPNIIGW